MRPPPFYAERHITREELEASFVPCKICGEKERDVGGGIYRIAHDLAAHGLAPRKPAPRMSTSELMGAVDTETLNRLGGMREA